MKSFKSVVGKMFSLLAVVCLLASSVYAGAGSSACDFLTIGIGARAVSMGGAFTGLADDVSAGYYNPGGMVQINDMEVLTMYNSWILGMSHIYLGLGKKLSNGGAFGLQVNTLTTGDIPGSTPDGAVDANFSATWMAVGLTYAGYVGEATSVGINVKNVSETIAGEGASGIAADLGMLYSTGEKTKLGLAVQNAGTGLQYAGDESATQFPMVMRGGISYAVTNEEEKGLIIAADVLSSNSGIGIGAGGEYRTGNVSLRAGIEQTGGSMVPSAGIGINTGSFLIDVGGGMMQELGSTYKVSLIGRFGGTGSAPARAQSQSKTKVQKAKVSKAGGNGLEAQLQKALAEEDYDKATEIKAKIVEKEVLQEKLNKALAAEDYDKATELKQKISELEK